MSDADVERLANLLGIPLEPESVAPVRANLTALLEAARLLADFALAEDVVPAPVFHP